VNRQQNFQLRMAITAGLNSKEGPLAASYLVLFREDGVIGILVSSLIAPAAYPINLSV
jgi:hypothetical protein